MKNKKSSFLTDNLGWITLALFAAIGAFILIYSISPGYSEGITFLRNWR